ncbi:MBL fold metallo-hydrolase [Myxococcaceae bacterium GXIMD 01537]
MSKKTWRRVGLAVAGLLVLVALFAAVALSDASIPEQSTFGVELEAVRALAVSSGEPLPTELRSQRIGKATGVPKGLVVTGSGFGPHTFEFYTYQVGYADGRTVLVDAVNDEQTARKNFPDSEFDAPAFTRMQEAMLRSDAVAITHEHFDHCAGLSRSPHLDALGKKAALTPEQLESKDALEAGFTPEVRAKFEPLRYERLHLLRPGVVLIKAPGHTPGSQMVYVRLAGGQEFLLVGDIAWHMENIRVPRMHPRLVNWLGHEDAPAMAGQLRWLHELQRTAPDLRLVVAHDGDQMRDYVSRGWVLDGLR